MSGTLTGFSGPVTISPQVIIGSDWSSAASFTASGSSYSGNVSFGAYPGNYTWRIVASDGTNTAISDTFTITRLADPSISVRTTGPATVNAPASISGSLTGFLGTVTISPQVIIGSDWSSAASFTASGSSYSGNVTFGSYPGTYTWRIVASDGVRTAVSSAFTITRMPTPSVSVSAVSPVLVNAPAGISGSLSGFSGPVTISPQVIIGSDWSSAASFTASGPSYSGNVTFGAYPGSYTWRIVATDGVRTAVSPAFTITRTAAANIDSRCLTGRTLCISKADRKLRWIVNGSIKMTLDVRFGSVATPTRNGQFKVDWKSRNHVSSIYKTAMPYAMFFSGGQAVHYSADFAARGYNGASHGCVNVRDKASIAALFDMVRPGDKVVVYQ